MYLDPKSSIAGQRALDIRGLLKRAGSDEFHLSWVAANLEVSEHEARMTLEELVRLGYVEPRPSRSNTALLYERTLSGAALALASATKPLTRVLAERRLQDFMDRVRLVNDSSYYLYNITQVIVFGSYLTTRDRINDVDVAVHLQWKESDPAKRRELSLGRIRDAIKGGRRFPNISAEYSWPETEVLLFLKARSRAIALHTTDDAILDRAPQRVLYSAEVKGEGADRV